MKEPGMIRALEVFEALEGKVEDRYCLFLNSKCEGRCALFGEITSLVNRQAREGNLYQYLFDRNSDCFYLKISE